jgi:DNA adenine methylase
MAPDTYIGSKNGNGVIHAIINNIPAHTRYFELFAGSAAVFHNKKPALFNYLSEINPSQADKLKASITSAIVKNVSALSVIDTFVFDGSDMIYLDPPYPFSSRRSGKKLYAYEMTDDDHLQLLSSIRTLNCFVMISTRHNELYDQVLHDWRKLEISTADRGGPATELLYMNYPEPTVLHQYNMLGINCTDRQRINRKIDRLKIKLSMLPALERYAIIQDIVKNNLTAVQSFTSMFTGKQQ